jgi:hypothetical protein
MDKERASKDANTASGAFFARIDLIEDLRWDVDPVIGGFVSNLTGAKHSTADTPRHLTNIRDWFGIAVNDSALAYPDIGASGVRSRGSGSYPLDRWSIRSGLTFVALQPLRQT